MTTCLPNEGTGISFFALKELSMRKKTLFLFLLSLVSIQTAFCSAAARTQDSSKFLQKRFFPLVQAFEKLMTQPFYQLKFHVRYQSLERIDGHLVFYVGRKPLQAVGKGDLQAQFQKNFFSFSGQEGYFRNILFFVVNKSSIGKPNFVNHWFELDFNQVERGIQPGNTPINPSQLKTEGKAMLHVIPVEPILSQVHVEEKPEGVANGVLCRHYVMIIPLGDLFRDLFKLLLPSLPHRSKFPTGQKFHPSNTSPNFNLSESFSKLPPVHANLWIGAENGLLYRVYVPLQEEGGLNLDVTYHPQPPIKHFKFPAAAADARVIGFIPTQSLLNFTSGSPLSLHLKQSSEWRQKGLAESSPIKARQDFLKAVREDPQVAENYYLAAKEDYQLKQYGRCAVTLNKAILLAPSSAKFYVLQGEAYQKLKFLALASWEYQAALYLNPDQKKIYLKLVKIYKKQRRFLEARKMLEKAKNLP